MSGVGPDGAATPGSAWRHAPDVAQVSGDDRYVLLDLAHPAVPPRVLTGPAAVIWASVDGRSDTPAVVAAVAEAVGASAEDVRDDVAAFLVELQASGLLIGPPESEG